MHSDRRLRPQVPRPRLAHKRNSRQRSLAGPTIRACFKSLLLALRHVQRVMDALQGAVPVPELEIACTVLFGGESLGSAFHLAAGPQHVEDPVQNLAHVPPSAPAVPPWRDHGR